MPTATENNKQVPDSQVTIDKKRRKDIEELAETKFGRSLIQVSLNRADQCFDVLVKNTATESEAKDFETLWPMCKVEILKSVPRKK